MILQFPDGHREALLEIYDGPGTQNFVGLSLQFRVDNLESFIANLPAGVSFQGPISGLGDLPICTCEIPTAFK